MMVIQISGDEAWSANNWVFRVLAARVTDACPEDEALLVRLIEAQALAHLPMQALDAALARRIAQSLLHAAFQERVSRRGKVSDGCVLELEDLLRRYLART